MLQPNRQRLREAADLLNDPRDKDVADWLRLQADEDATYWMCLLPWLPPGTPGAQAEDTAMHVIRVLLASVPPEAKPRLMAYWLSRAQADAADALPL
jgi:hypothetical protein